MSVGRTKAELAILSGKAQIRLDDIPKKGHQGHRYRTTSFLSTGQPLLSKETYFFFLLLPCYKAKIKKIL